MSKYDPYFKSGSNVNTVSAQAYARSDSDQIERKILVSLGIYNKTCKEIEEDTGLAHETVSGCLSHLEELGPNGEPAKVIRTGDKRRTPCGNMAHVYSLNSLGETTKVLKKTRAGEIQRIDKFLLFLQNIGVCLQNKNGSLNTEAWKEILEICHIQRRTKLSLHDEIHRYLQDKETLQKSGAL